MCLPSIALTGNAQKEAWQNKVLPSAEQLVGDVWSIWPPVCGWPASDSPTPRALSSPISARTICDSGQAG